MSFVRRLTAEQIDQVVALLRSKNEEYLALGGTGASAPGTVIEMACSTRWQWTVSCVDLPWRCRSRARPICVSHTMEHSGPTQVHLAN